MPLNHRNSHLGAAESSATSGRAQRLRHHKSQTCCLDGVRIVPQRIHQRFHCEQFLSAAVHSTATHTIKSPDQISARALNSPIPKTNHPSQQDRANCAHGKRVQSREILLIPKLIPGLDSNESKLRIDNELPRGRSIEEKMRVFLKILSRAESSPSSVGKRSRTQSDHQTNQHRLIQPPPPAPESN